MCDCDYDGIADVWRDEYRVARKEHTCYECGSMIQPKEKYEYTTVVFDGTVRNYKTCWDCVDLRKFFHDIQEIELDVVKRKSIHRHGKNIYGHYCVCDPHRGELHDEVLSYERDKHMVLV